MGNSRRAPHSRAGLLPTQLNLSGRASRAALDGFRCFLFSNACRRCIPRGWALFLQPVFHSGHIGNAVPGGVPFFTLCFFGISVPQGWVGSCKTRPPHSSSSRSCLSLFAVCFSEIRGKPSAFLPNRLPRQDGFPPSGQLRLPTMDGSSPPPSLMK